MSYHAAPLSYSSVHPQLAPQIYDDFRELSLYATFNADEAIAQLRGVLEKNLSSKKTQENILKEVTSELIKHAWEEKLKHILESIKLQMQMITNPNVQNPKLDLSFYEEINDIVAFLQIIGGLNPQEAERAGIQHDFQFAIDYTLTLIQKLFLKIENKFDPWPDCPGNSPACQQMKKTRSKVFMLIFKTIAALINSNISYFDSPELLIKFLKQIMNMADNNGRFAPLLSPHIEELYNRIQEEMFMTKLNTYSLQSVVKSAIKGDKDISEAIARVPNDIRKFQILKSLAQEDEKYSELLKQTIVKSNELDVIHMGTKITFVHDESFKKALTSRLFDVLSECLSTWINELLIRPNPLNDDYVKKAYFHLSKIMSSLSASDRKKLFFIIKETELSHSITALCQRDPELKQILAQEDSPAREDQMVKDILSLIRD